MKNSVISLLFTVAALLFSSNAQGQLLKKLKKGIQEATEDVLVEKASEKAAQETGKALDSLLEIDPDYEPNSAEKWNAIFAQGGADIPIEESYQFDTNVLYTMEVSSDNNSSVVDYSMWFSDKENYMATQVSNIQQESSGKNQDMPVSMFSVIDDKNQAMVVLMEQQKIAQVISMEKVKGVTEQENETEGIDESFGSIEKTGRKKDILGYACEEFEASNDDTKFSFWVTQELDLYQKNMFFNISRSLGGSTFDKIPKEAGGFMMEMNYEHISGKDSGSMVVKEIRKERKIVETAGYQYMNLSQFMGN